MTDFLPSDDLQRNTLHNELHARPSARIRLPALVIHVAVINQDVTREQECMHLRRLPGQQDLALEKLQSNFLRLRFDGYTVKWERHSEFSRYAIVQSLPAEATLGARDPELHSKMVVTADWLRNIPGRTIAAIQLAMVPGDLTAAGHTLGLARRWFADRPIVAAMMGHSSHSWVLADFQLRDDGFERMLVVARPDMSETLAGRVSQRLLEMETYRMMALRGLPEAKSLGAKLTEAERELSDITAQLESKTLSDRELLDTLVSLAARIERATAEHDYRFAATRAYENIVTQRIVELREQQVQSIQTLGEFLQRRLSPAMATVDATSQRLVSLSERITRTSALLRTRVDIATEEQNRQLLEKLTRGQEMQLRLQTTVEGLSIAAISYYVVSLLLYVVKAVKAAGVPINAEVAAGVLIPIVLWGVWRTTRRIHAKLHVEP